MAKSIPIVRSGRLVHPVGHVPSIPLDSDDWFAWLNDPATNRFSYPVFNPKQGYIEGFMTLRKEPRQRGGAYWSVYRRHLGRLRKIYLGASTALTKQRLEEIAASFLPPEPDAD